MKRNWRLATVCANGDLYPYTFCRICAGAFRNGKPDSSCTATFAASLKPDRPTPSYRRFSKTETNAKPTAAAPLSDKIIVSLAHCRHQNGFRRNSVVLIPSLGVRSQTRRTSGARPSYWKAKAQTDVVDLGASRYWPRSA